MWCSVRKKFHKQVPNDREGFQQMLAEIPSDAPFLMEATGTSTTSM